MDGPVFQIFWKKCFPNISKKYPLLRARRRPEGAAGGGARGIFSKYLENRPLFSKYLEKRPIHIFLIDTFQFFQITTIYKGTQDTRTAHKPTDQRLLIAQVLPEGAAAAYNAEQASKGQWDRLLTPNMVVTQTAE